MSIVSKSRAGKAGVRNLRPCGIWLAGITAATLIGCSGPTWIIPLGGSQQQFQSESYECERDAAMLPAPAAPTPLPPSYSGTVSPGGFYTVTPQPNPGQGFQDLSIALGNRAQRQGLFDRCMTSKGTERQLLMTDGRSRSAGRLLRRCAIGVAWG